MRARQLGWRGCRPWRYEDTFVRFVECIARWNGHSDQGSIRVCLDR